MTVTGQYPSSLDELRQGLHSMTGAASPVPQARDEGGAVSHSVTAYGAVSVAHVGPAHMEVLLSRKAPGWSQVLPW